MHRRMYYLQCHVTHANDAMSFVRFEPPGNAHVQLAANAEQVRQVLVHAFGNLIYIVQALETTLGYDANFDGSFQKYQQLASVENDREARERA